MSITTEPYRLRAFDRLLQPVENFLNMVAALAILALMFLGVSQILLRKFANSPIFGYVDLVELSMATFAFLGAAYCQRLGDHIRMEILIGSLKGRALWWAELISTFAALVIVGILIWFGWDHFMRSYQLGDTTIDAEYPVWPSKLLVPIAFSVWWLRLLIQFFGFLRLVREPDAEPVAVPLMEDAATQAQEEIREAFGQDFSADRDNNENNRG